MTSQFSKTSFWNFSQTKNLFCLTRQHHMEISHLEKQAHFCHRSSIIFCTKYQENRKKSYLSKANKECVNISTECHKSIHKAAHVDPIQQLWIFCSRKGLCLAAPHFDSNSPVIQKWTSSQSQKIDLQLFHFHLWNITAPPRGPAPTDTEFICPFAFCRHVRSAP